MAESIASLIDRAEETPTIASLRRAASDRDRSRLGRALGRRNEERLLRVLREAPPAWLRDVRLGTVSEDRGGSDLVATLSSGLQVGIQVKSSAARAMRFVEESRRRHGGWSVALVVVRQGESDEDLRARAIERVEALLVRLGPKFSSHR